MCLLPGGFGGRASVTKGDWKDSMESLALRVSRESWAVNIAASVEVCQTGQMSGGRLRVLGKGVEVVDGNKVFGLSS